MRVTANSPNEALAASDHLLDGGLVGWKYDRTIEITDPTIEITEVK